ncbi:nuclear pore complex protein NUP96 [Selaginella moellendorffii]|uniref:nuclear pore complex protein NUP96 n=1 Tax=Selaginella moellendorffii TaxID=88036 RepID=UPI000D1C9033|nr:nuclear pore complex protein NUP96 [Selaginella moellendorffii]|eukprot:XP_024531189.1 nuclear pore complex protein NUP96 [Selaginella moellendorffii]
MIFGSSSPFGASSPSLFGGASASSSPFGSTTSTSPFGMNSAATNPFAAKPFGSPTFGQQTGGLFGSGTATGVFGASQAAPFGSSSPAFGSATASPFGNTQSAFGASGSPVFGQIGQKPASPFGSFGNTSSPSNPFAAPAFGQTQASFGTQQLPTFGASQPAFGASSTPAFGSTSAFSSQPAASFGNPFGATSSAFGSSTPVFGQSAPAFGTASSPAFGSTPAGFGTGGFNSQPTSAFGSTISFGARPGSRAIPYVPKTEIDGSATLKLYSISAIEGYHNKSHEELRWEDYQAGDKGGPAPNNTGVFGQPSSSSPFGSSSLTPSVNPFGASSSFSQQQKPQTSFPSFSTTSTPTFGSSPSIFNSVSAPAISSAPSFGTFNSSPSLFNTQSAFSTPSSTPAFGNSSFGVQQAPIFPSPQTTQPVFGQSSAPIFGSSNSSSLFNNMSQPKPAGAPSFFPSSQPNTTSFSFPSQTQPQGLFQSTPSLTPFAPPTISTTMAPMPAPVSAPFGTLPAMPQMSIGRAAGSNPTVQYGISSIPVSDRPAQIHSNSLLIPRHITPRSKIRMHARKSNAKKDSPKVSFFSEGEEAPVTPKADVSIIPRENPRALFIHQVNQAPVTAVAAKRAPDIVNLEHSEDLYNEPKSFPVVGDDSLPPDMSGLDWSIPSTTDGLQAAPPKKVSSKSPSKQNGVREELNHRGNGYISLTGHRAGEAAIAYEHGADIEALMPKLKHSDYYTEPRVQELAAKERAEPGYCRRVSDFIVGRKGYGHIKFLGETDVRRLDIEGIIQFNKCEVLVYMDESKKPPLGQGLNKPAEVTLLNVMCIDKSTGRSVTDGAQAERFEKKLKKKTQAQGAEFVSFDVLKGEWTFRVKHFSRYAFDESEDSEDDALESGKLVPAVMDMMEGVEDEAAYRENGAEVFLESRGPSSVDEGEEELMEDVRSRNHRTALPHSLPAQLKLDPLKLHQLKASFFPLDENESAEMTDVGTYKKSTPPSVIKQYKSSLEEGELKRPSKQIKLSPHSLWQRSPMLLPQQSSFQALTAPTPSLVKTSRKLTSGFRLQESDSEKLLSTSNSGGGVVDAALFMGTSFRAGWGPNGVLVHSGSSVGQSKATTVVSSSIKLETVSLDRTARDDRGKVKDILLDFQFNAPLALHMSLSKVVSESNGLKMRSLVCSKDQLERLTNDYEDLIEKQHGTPGVSAADQLVLKHQVLAWQLICVLFSEKDALVTETEEASESMAEMKARIANIDPGTETLVRKAAFSGWLQDSVFHLVQADLDSTGKDASHIRDIMVLLTGKQVELGVRKAILAGDVRLACLLSQGGGLVANREDILSQLEVWESEGLCDGLIENDRISLFRLLGGDIHGSLGDQEIDWKRFMGMLMWYTLPPEAGLPDIILEFQRLVEEGDAFKPVPMYIEEAPVEVKEAPAPPPAYDSAYYLMLLHARGSLDESDVNKMFSSSASTFDRLDHRAAWHQKEVLQAIGVLNQSDSYALDMSFVSQLLAANLIHWAIYVVLHMPVCPETTGLHEKVVKDILSQYSEVWSNSEVQQKFIEDELGIPPEWLHETLAIYWLYRGDFEKSLVHYLKSFMWQEAHVVFMTKVSASLLLNGKKEEIWSYASQMDAHKMEIENWDIGSGLYIDFFTLLGSFENSEAYDTELESPVEAKMCACKDFFERLKESQRLWEAKASKLLRLALTRMADEVAALLVSESKVKRVDASLEMEIQSVAMEAGSPEDVQLCRLQGAVSSFSNWIVQIAA